MGTRFHSLGRRSRLRANSTGKRIRLTERDWAWLRAIHRHGPLASSYLLAFGEQFGRSRKRAKERLGDLFHEDNTEHGGAYLLRPPQQFQTFDSRYNQLVYDLAPAAKTALKQRGSWSEWSGPNGGPWWHTFMVSSITSSIQLGCLERDDVRFIPQSKILDRAGVPLTCTVRLVDPVSGEYVNQVIKPDALFGLEYLTPDGNRFRFFALEADRATEPLTSKSNSRKSLLRSLRQYDQMLTSKSYRRQFRLTAPLLQLTVTTSTARRDAFLKIMDTAELRSRAAMLVSAWDCFSGNRSIPNVNYALLNEPWARSKMPTISIA